MTAPSQSHAMAFLPRAGLLAGVLAVIAGILGMHVVTGSHSMHAPAAMTAATARTVHAESPVHGHSGHPVAGMPSTLPVAGSLDMAESSAELCSNGSNSAQTTTVSCTPSAKTGSLAAPMPGTAVSGSVPAAGTAGALPRPYSYLSGSPSPAELSISRT
ncbi:MAG: hypothetical protein JWO29_2016 [Arthrobacter sp.]|nr:hypothetical protein [Arthrobacter sp.]